MNVKLHIDRLVIENITASRPQRRTIKSATENELVRLLSAGELNPVLLAGGELPVVKTCRIQLPQGSPASLGKMIAGAVYGGIGK